jgi:hypothetical protein
MQAGTGREDRVTEYKVSCDTCGPLGSRASTNDTEAERAARADAKEHEATHPEHKTRVSAQRI